MVCVAVTRGGFGDVWLFDSRTEAFLHPIVQYGDALLLGPEDLVYQYNWLEWNNLRRLAGMEPLPPADLTRRQHLAISGQQSGRIFEALLARASRPPSDPQQTCDIVSRDRRLGTMAKKKEDAPKPPAGTVRVAPTPKDGDAVSPVGVRGPKGVPLDAVIHMGHNKDGVPFGPDNNPKKPGSKTHGRFALYVQDMTIEQAIAAGIPTADLVYDRDHGFIKFHGGTPAGSAAPAGKAEPKEKIELSEEEQIEELLEEEAEDDAAD